MEFNRGLLDYVLWIIYDTITEHAIIVINLKINYQKYKIYFKMQPTCLSYRIKYEMIGPP